MQLRDVIVPIFAELLLNDLVVRKRDTLLVDLTITALYKSISI
jgi:hypothetical protein